MRDNGLKLVIKSGQILDAFLMEKMTRVSYIPQVERRRKKGIKDNKKNTWFLIMFSFLLEVASPSGEEESKFIQMEEAKKMQC